MIFSVNVDPRFPEGAAEFDELKALGIQGVAIVSRADTHEYAWAAKEAGLHVLARIDKSSEGHMIPADVYQIGNEPDHVSESSWTMTPDEYVALWRQYRNTYPALTMIGAGLASGDPSWWRSVAPRLTRCTGVGVHPYAKNASEAITLIKVYADIIPRHSIWISEWNRPASEIPVFAGMLGGSCAYAAWFCWSDEMVQDMGLYRGGTQKVHALYMREALKAWSA